MLSPIASALAAHKSAAQRPSVRAYSGAKGAAKYDLDYYLRASFAGGVCCSLTHGAVCPVDVVKTRMQLQPAKYSGIVSSFKTVIAEEGVGALATGLGPTVVGYFVQGWFKFGGVEFFKINFSDSLGPQKAWDNRLGIYLASAAFAEFIADVFLCPLEATRIKLVANPSYASGLLTAAPKIIKDEGFMRGFYSGFVPILFKQIPYTMAKFSVQGWAAEKMATAAGIPDLSKASEGTKVSVSLSSGVVAGVAAAIISHPADTLLSVINKPGAGGQGSMVTRLGRVAAEMGAYKLMFNGLPMRCVMIGTLTAGQFAVFDVVMNWVGAKKFHFHVSRRAELPCGTATAEGQEHTTLNHALTPLFFSSRSYLLLPRRTLRRTSTKRLLRSCARRPRPLTAVPPFPTTLSLYAQSPNSFTLSAPRPAAAARSSDRRHGCSLSAAPALSR